MSTIVPMRFMVGQNTPNPFNPITAITYDIPEKSHVVLEVYNVLGQIVATLVDEEQEPGSRSVEWQPRDNAGSGIYFYRLSARSLVNSGKMFVQVRKMMLMKVIR